LEGINAEHSKDVTPAIKNCPEEILLGRLTMEKLTDFLSNNLIPSFIHMAPININVFTHIKRVREIMNPIKMFSFFDFQHQGINQVKLPPQAGGHLSNVFSNHICAFLPSAS
jgi:hypothetical protein